MHKKLPIKVTILADGERPFMAAVQVDHSILDDAVDPEAFIVEQFRSIVGPFLVALKEKE